MSEINTQGIDLTSLKGDVVIVTGGSSGIGLATVKLLLEHGATVINGDLNEPDLTHPSLTYHRTDVTSWQDLTNLFKQTKHSHSSINHVFVNAGVASTTDYYLDEHLDEAGDLLEPNSLTIDTNLRAAINTVTLAVHHMRRQQPAGGSIVITGSASSFQPMPSTAYTTAKHGMLGFARSMKASLGVAGLADIRINTIAPNWTQTPLFPFSLIEAAGVVLQSPEVVATSAALLMADRKRNGQVVYSEAGRMWEVEEAVLVPAAVSVRVPGTLTLEETLVKALGIAKDGGVVV